MKVRRVESRLAEIAVEYESSVTCNTADKVAVLCDSYRNEAVEVFIAVLLNGKHKPIGIAEVSRGTLTASLVHPREVFGPALRMGAAAIIVVHNHPSGEPEPSGEDIQVTQRLIKAGVLLGVPLLDHVILGADSHVSLRREGHFS